MTMTPDPVGATQRIEAYLDQVSASVARGLSVFHGDELRRELRAHLWERIEAYQELGQPEEDAVTEALRQFGGAGDFLRQWRREWVTLGRIGTWQEITAAAWPALRLCIPLLLTAWLAAQVLEFAVINALPSTYSGALLTVYINSLFAVCCAGFFHLSLWSGLVHGRRTPCRGGIGMFAALSVVVVAGSGLYEISEVTGLDRTILGDLFASLPLMAATWMPTACLAATLGGWLTQRQRKVTA